MPAPQSRDERWFEDLFDRYHPHVLAYARRRLPSDAEDVAVDVFAAAWTERDRMPDAPLPWLYRCARNRVLTRQRSRNRQLRLTLKLTRLSPSALSPQAAESGDADEWTRRLFDVLPDAEIEILKLAIWEELPLTEIAYVLGCSPGAARTRLYRARNHARETLAALGHPATGHSATTYPATP